MKDIRSLGAVTPMNQLGTGQGNWEWQLTQGQLTPKLAVQLRALTETYGRG